MEERYLTTQHERDQETDLDYRGARYYDNEVGRFLSTDPWQDKYPEWSTYNYVIGNPLIFIDPTGKGPTTKYYSETGHLIVETHDGSDDEIVISNDYKSEFMELVIWTGDDVLDSEFWNENMKTGLLGFSNISQMNNILGGTSNQTSRQALINFYQDNTTSNWFAYLGWEVLGQNLNPLNHLPSPIGIKTKLPKVKGGSIKQNTVKPKTEEPSVKVSPTTKATSGNKSRKSNPWIQFNREMGAGKYTKNKYGGSSEKAQKARRADYTKWKSEHGYRI